LKAEIVKEFTFEAAHHLPEVGAAHKCSRMHGHLFRVEVAVEGDIDPVYGWVMDFADLAGAARQVIAELDHRTLNALPGLDNPTSENLARYLYDRLAARVPEVSAVTVHESPTSRCTWRPVRPAAPSVPEIGVTVAGRVFSSAHLLVLPPDARETIHGHDYRMTVRAAVPPGRSVAAEDALAAAADEAAALLDHKVLLAETPAVGRLEDRGDSWSVVAGPAPLSLPKSDCVLLDVHNTTTEAIAGWIAKRLAGAAAVRETGALRVEVSLVECLDATARVEVTL
jgi:6-pyruvoyltetrahydropterin/6-carboxytetrahydropterin synthase